MLNFQRSPLSHAYWVVEFRGTSLESEHLTRSPINHSIFKTTAASTHRASPSKRWTAQNGRKFSSVARPADPGRADVEYPIRQSKIHSGAMIKRVNLEGAARDSVAWSYVMFRQEEEAKARRQSYNHSGSQARKASRMIPIEHEKQEEKVLVGC